jgi:hypothetical protein
METVNARDVSVLEPIGGATEKTKKILFSPFNAEKWFVIGFCAWLAALCGGGGGGGINFNLHGDSSCRPVNFHQVGREVSTFISQSLPWLLPVAAGGLILIVAIAVLVIWLKSRGQFMFLDCIARDRAAVAAPWAEYKAEGNSLFGFKFLLWLAGFVLSLALLVPLIIILIMFLGVEFKTLLIGPAIGGAALVFLLIVMGMAYGVVTTLTDDFVVPVMYLRRCGVKAAWKECMGLFSARPGMFVLYLVFLMLIGVVLGFLSMFFGMAACCCFCCVAWVFLIPFVGGYLMTVVLLPLAVWRRSYALLFLAQFGPEYDVFATVPLSASPAGGGTEIVPVPSDDPAEPPYGDI